MVKMRRRRRSSRMNISNIRRRSRSRSMRKEEKGEEKGGGRTHNIIKIKQLDYNKRRDEM